MKHLFFLVLPLLLICSASAQTTYTLQILGNPGASAGPSAINDNGDVAGVSNFGTGPSQAVLWPHSGGTIDVGAGTRHSAATALNNSDQVVGYFWDKIRMLHAFLWTASGGFQDLGTLGGCCSAAYGISDNGEVVGSAYTSSNAIGAFTWTSAAGMKTLSTGIGFYKDITATAVNANGYVVGYGVVTSTGKTRGLFWTPTGVIRDIGDLTGGTSWTWAYGINATNDVVGMTLASDGDYLAFQLQNPFLGNTMQSLGLLGSYTVYSAYAINNSGEIVGSANCPSCGNSHAFVYTASGGLQDLNTLVTNNSAGWILTSAVSVNSSGQIAVQVFNSSGTARAAVLTPSAQ